MASPISHSLTGLALATLFRSPARQSGWFVALSVSVVLANLPDIDFLFGPLMGASAGAFHRTWTHGLLFWLVVSFAIAPFLRLERGFWRNWLFCLLPLGSHLLIDFFTGPHLGLHRTYGLPLFAPFSARDCHSPLTLIVGPKSSADDLLGTHNLLWGGFEILVFGLLLALAFVLRMRRRPASGHE